MSSPADLIWHRPECDRSRPVRERVVSGGEFAGRTIARCLSCGRWAVDRDAALAAERAQDVAAAEFDTSRAAADLSRSVRWVCSAHLDQPVDWRGRGCLACAAERKRSQMRRRVMRPSVAEDDE